MKRREFVSLFSSLTGAALLSAHAPGWAQASAVRASSVRDRVLILIELKGGNDGLNTVVPYASNTYYQLRNTIGIPADTVIRLDEKTGLHPGLKALMPLWEQQELGIVQSVGYPQPNLSHFRSIEIWETASKSTEYLDKGWAARGLTAGLPAGAAFTADGVMIGGGDFGALAGARAVSLNNPEAFVNQSRFAQGANAAAAGGNPALAYLLRVEDDVNHAAEGLRGNRFDFKTTFPTGAFGNSVKAAAQVVASQKGRGGVPVITLTLGSFDTHQNQTGTQAGLLRQLAEGIAALKSSLTELDAWDRTLVMTFSEFGRRARQNNSGGTDHGTAAPHLVAGGAVRGGLYGQAPDLDRLDGGQNVVYSTDFRQLYATVARDWWGVNPTTVVRGDFEPVRFLRDA
ncbi:MAG: DUF1501 domain-containing protein [Polaromonas sp.]|nr:DUF1501 domain-containing protein [Polaromonas sp.]